MSETYKIFISSTYKDLEEYHNASAKAVRGLGYRAISMEDFPAGEERPVDKSLADVRSCDIYIGILAFRYGEPPKGYDKSITHLEYGEAGSTKIPRLLFVLDEGTPWPANMIDKDRTRIDDFRKIVMKKHVVKISNLDDLKFEIAKALKETIGKFEGTTGQPRPPVPPHLPYLSNRSKQRDDLIEVLDKCQDKSDNQPIVCVIHGDETECHDQFLEKMRDHLLPDLLNLDSKHNSIGLERINWPGPEKHLEKRLERAKAEISKRLTGSARTDVQKMVQAINDRKRLIIHFSLQTAGWQANEAALIKALLEYWQTLPGLLSGRRLFVLFCIKYKDTNGLPAFLRMRFNKQNQRARRFIESLGAAPTQDLCSGVLRELKALNMRSSTIGSWSMHLLTVTRLDCKWN